MFFNATLIAVLCAAGHSVGSINTAPTGELVVRLPKTINMSQASEAAAALSKAGAFVTSYGVNLSSPYDNLVGATITIDGKVHA